MTDEREMRETFSDARGGEARVYRAPEIYVCSPAQGVSRVDGE